MKLFAAAMCCAALAASCSGDEPNPVPGGFELNPSPSPVAGIGFFKATFDTAEFNMISEPGFELYPDEAIDYRSLWFFEGAGKDPVQAFADRENPHGGSVALRLDNPNDGQWCDACLQSVAVKRGRDYTMSCFGMASWADQNAFAGVRLEGGGIYDEKVAAWNADEWTEYVKELNTGDCVQANVFVGAWGWPGVWVKVDDFRLIPTGTTQTSVKLASCSKVSELSNASFTELGKVGKTVIWPMSDGKIAMALHDVTSGGVHYDNAFAVTDDANPADGLYLARVGDGKSVTPLLEPSADELSVVPTAGVAIGDTQYVHYYSLRGIDSEDDQSWTANFSGLLSSADGGRTWTRENRGRWSGAGHFVQVAFYVGDTYLYMFGSDAGRSTPKIYVARIRKSDEVAVAANWSYWDGSEWVTGEPDAAAAVTYGNASEMCVTYDAVHMRYILAYRSNTTGGLVFRDAGSPEGDWSGEKVLMLDGDSDTRFFSPSVYPSADGTMYFVASVL